MLPKFTFFCIFFVAARANSIPFDSRIIGGVEANKGEFPHLVSIQFTANNKHNCGGSIINERWILTAAHCVPQSVNDIVVKAGKHYVNTKEPSEQSSMVEQMIVHENYGTLQICEPGCVGPYDFALLKLKTPLRFNNRVRPIKLSKSKALPKKEVTVAGWGTVSSNGLVFPATVHKVNVPLIDLETCNSTILSVNSKVTALHETNLCTGPLSGGRGACFGDSGSPLVTSVNGEFEAIGVFSWITMPCSGRDRVTVYGRVSIFNDWVQRVITTHSDTPLPE